MSLETANPEFRTHTGLSRLSQAWRHCLATIAFGLLAVVSIAAREWGEMVHQWWNIDTYTHILLVPVIIGWLIAVKAKELAKFEPRAWWPGLTIVAMAVGLWLLGRQSEINLFAHAGAVGAAIGVLMTALGVRACLVLALPLAFTVFLVPFGDEIIPPLQMITADIAVTLTHWSGVPAVVDGIYIDTPVGLFIVAEACSGVKFLIAMVTLAVLVSFTRFKSWSRRAAFMALSIIVPIIANGIRAWGTIYIAQSQGVEFAAGFDHIFYGWVFFAIVVALVLAAAWPFFEREPEDYGWTFDEVDQFTWVDEVGRHTISPIVAVAGFAGLAICAAIVAKIVAPAALG